MNPVFLNEPPMPAPVAALVAAVLYLRNSSDEQDLSIDQQRQAVTEFALAQGYTVVGEYLDEGKSGSKHTAKRVAFAKMIQDGQHGKFQVIVCWDAARFARLDTIGSGVYKDALRTSNIVLDTVKEGRFDWHTDEGRMKDFLYSEANRKHSLNISKDSLRGRADIARQGFWPHGEVPYGYDREYQYGGRVVRVGRTEEYSAGRKERLKLVVNEAEAKVVRDIFTKYADGQSLHSIMKDLLARGVPSPTGGHWGYTTLRNRITDITYTGTIFVGKNKPNGKERFNKATEQTVEDAHEAIIPPALYDRAQERIKPGTAHHKHGTSALGGFLICGHCGMRLLKVKSKSGNTRYRCQSKVYRPHTGCSMSYYVSEADELPFLLKWITATVDEELVKAMGANPHVTRPEIGVVQDQVKQLQTKYDRAKENALHAPKHLPADIKADLWQDLERIKEEMTAAQERLETIERPMDRATQDELHRWYEDLTGKVEVPVKDFIPDDTTAYIWSSEKGLRLVSTTDAVRAFMTRFAVKVTYTWDENPKYKKHGDKAAKHVIAERKVEGVFSNQRRSG